MKNAHIGYIKHKIENAFLGLSKKKRNNISSSPDFAKYIVYI